LGDLGELMARWLEGEIASRPGYHGEPDEETEPLIPALAAVNRAGYLTEQSQPGFDGTGYDGARWRQRASVEGFADDQMYARIREAAEPTRLVLIAHKAGRWRTARPAMTVTDRAGRPCTGFGVRMSRRFLRWLFSECSRPATAALCDAWQITLVDPEWNRDDVLWPLLQDIARTAGKGDKTR
jgi:hypothetical protein